MFLVRRATYIRGGAGFASVQVWIDQHLHFVASLQEAVKSGVETRQPPRARVERVEAQAPVGSQSHS